MTPALRNRGSVQQNHGWSYLLAILSFPYLLLARSGLFGAQARDEANAAVATQAGYAALLLSVLAVVIAGIVIGYLILSLT